MSNDLDALKVGFIVTFIEKYAERFFPGRRFSVIRDTFSPDYIVSEYTADSGGWTTRHARIPGSLTARFRSNRLGVAREIAIILDDAFDTRSEAEKLPWQLFSL